MLAMEAYNSFLACKKALTEKDCVASLILIEYSQLKYNNN